MDVRSRIEAYGGTLTGADRKLASVVVNDPTAAAFLSAEQLGDMAGVHAATVVRFARKLGFEGFTQLRLALGNEVRERVGAAERVNRVLSHSPQGEILPELIAAEIANLEKMIGQVSAVDLADAARLLSQADRTHVFARGHATALADLLERRLRRSGLPVSDLRGTDRDLAERLVSLSADDVVVAFALRIVPPGLESLLAIAAASGTPVILISDALGPVIRPKPDVLLSASRGDESEFQSLTVPMVIINALVLTLASVDEGQSFAALEDVDALIQRFS